MNNNQIVESFWERVSLAEPDDKFIISMQEAKQVLALTKSDIYNKVDLDFEPIKNKAEKLYNEFASLINDSWMKAKLKTPYTHKTFFTKYLKLNTELLYLYVESNVSDHYIEELNQCNYVLTESFIE